MSAKYAVLMTGPSATADIEGVLVRGAQGIRSLKLRRREARADKNEWEGFGRRLSTPTTYEVDSSSWSTRQNV